MNPTYYKTITQMEKAGVDPEYIQGWEGGYLHNPKREEQRLTEAYNAGYEDGYGGKTGNYTSWVRKN